MFFSRKKNAPPVTTTPTLVKLDQEKKLILESVGSMERASGVHTLIISYQDTVRRLEGFELLARDCTFDFDMDIREDVDSLFAGRLPLAVGLDLQAGKNPQELLNALEGCGRAEDGVVEDAIMEAQDQVFRFQEGATDWSLVTGEGLALDRDDMEEIIAGAARQRLEELSQAQASGQKGR